MKASATGPTCLTPSPRCDLCQGGEFETVATRDRRGQPLETVLCTSCGLLSHARIPTEAELAGFYADHYRRDYHGETSPTARRVMRAWRKGELTLRRLVPFLRTTDRILEVGAGIGCTTKVLELAGFAAEGIEPNHGFRQYGLQQLHARLRSGSLFDLAPEARYDAVLLVHVIEHFRSPRRALDHIYQLLTPGGRLYVECPNAAALRPAAEQMFHFAHIHNFTAPTLNALARRAGFEVVTQFATPTDPNLRMLLVKTTGQHAAVDAESCRHTREALAAAGAVRYYLRGQYLRDRISLAMRAVAEFLMAGWYVRSRITKCQPEGLTRDEASLLPAAGTLLTMQQRDHGTPSSRAAA